MENIKINFLLSDPIIDTFKDLASCAVLKILLRF